MTSSSNRILYLVSLNHATNDGSVYLLSSLFPIVLALFNISVFQVGIIVALGYLVNILFQPVVGHYSEGRDPERLLAIGISVITVSVISFVFATGFLSLLASVILLRLGSSFFHPVGISAISKSNGGPRLQKSMGFQSAFGNVGVLLVFLTSAPLYLALGWRATFIVFAIWTLADVVLTLTFLRGRHSAGSDDPQTPSISKPQTRRMIPLFFVLAAFTLLSGNAILATITLLATGFSISATYPLTYTELSRYLGSIGQQSGRSFGVLSSGQTIGASILGLASGYVSQFFSLEVSFASVAMLALVGSVSAAFWIKRREPKRLIADIG